MRSELLRNIWLYLSGSCTLQNLETWVLSNLQRILDSGDEEAIHVANQVDADIVELGEDLVSEKTFREHLQNYLSNYETIPFSFYEVELPSPILAGTAVETINQESEITGPVEDLRLDHVFA